MKYREKIAEIIKKNGTYNGRSLSFDYYVVKPDDLATALIENGYGNVAEWKRRAEVAEKERDEYRKSTHIALKGIEILKRNILRYCVADFPNILQEAEKELEAEKEDKQ